MPVFGCASDEQFKLESFEIALKANSIKIKKSDLKMFWAKYFLAMEQFIKDKGLFEEFQEKIKPQVNFDCEVINANFSR